MKPTIALSLLGFASTAYAEDVDLRDGDSLTYEQRKEGYRDIYERDLDNAESRFESMRNADRRGYSDQQQLKVFADAATVHREALLGFVEQAETFHLNADSVEERLWLQEGLVVVWNTASAHDKTLLAPLVIQSCDENNEELEAYRNGEAEISLDTVRVLERQNELGSLLTEEQSWGVYLPYASCWYTTTSSELGDIYSTHHETRLTQGTAEEYAEFESELVEGADYQKAYDYYLEAKNLREAARIASEAVANTISRIQDELIDGYFASGFRVRTGDDLRNESIEDFRARVLFDELLGQFIPAFNMQTGDLGYWIQRSDLSKEAVATQLAPIVEIARQNHYSLVLERIEETISFTFVEAGNDR